MIDKDLIYAIEDLNKILPAVKAFFSLNLACIGWFFWVQYGIKGNKKEIVSIGLSMNDMSQRILTLEETKSIQIDECRIKRSDLIKSQEKTIDNLKEKIELMINNGDENIDILRNDFQRQLDEQKKQYDRIIDILLKGNTNNE